MQYNCLDYVKKTSPGQKDTRNYLVSCDSSRNRRNSKVVASTKDLQ